MTTATPVRRAKRKVRIGLARFCELSAPGEPPTSARILAAGRNKTDKGDLVFTPRSAKLVMAAFADRKNPLAWYYNHEDQLPLEKQGGAPMKGACSAPSSVLAIHDSPTGPECWADEIAWTDEAKRQIKSGERRQLSPVAAFDLDTREVLEILNVSLVGEGATHNGTLLASRSAKGTGSMEELLDKMMEAIDAQDWETLESLAQEAESGDGDEMARMAKMARAAMKAGKTAKPAAPPPAPADAPAATKRLAAARADLAVASVASFDRAVAEMSAATKRADDAAKRSDRATVQTLIAANRDAFDVTDERQHMTASDPTATQRHIESFTRKAKAGVIVLAKPSAEAVAAKAGESKPEAGKKRTLNDGERRSLESFNRGKDAKFHITEEEFLAREDFHGLGKKPNVGVA